MFVILTCGATIVVRPTTTQQMGRGQSFGGKRAYTTDAFHWVLVHYTEAVSINSVMHCSIWYEVYLETGTVHVDVPQN